jgi:hypothetical protein
MWKRDEGVRSTNGQSPAAPQPPAPAPAGTGVPRQEVGPRMEKDNVKAQVFAKAVIVLGEVTGNVTASDKVDIRDNGSVDGDIVAPRVAIAEGAHFRGSVDMQRKAGAASAKPEVKPVAVATQPAPAQPAQAQPQAAAQRVGA